MIAVEHERSSQYFLHHQYRDDVFPQEANLAFQGLGPFHMV